MAQTYRVDETRIAFCMPVSQRDFYWKIVIQDKRHRRLLPRAVSRKFWDDKKAQKYLDQMAEENGWQPV